MKKYSAGRDIDREREKKKKQNKGGDKNNHSERQTIEQLET